MNTARLARLEHLLNLQTALLHAILDDMRPEDRRRTLERFTAAVVDLPPVGDDADAAGAAWCVALLEDVRR